MTETYKEWINVVLKQLVTENEKISKVVETNTEVAVKRGDNYGSQIARVVLKILLENGNIIERRVILKDLPLVERRRVVIKEMGVFKREILIYQDVLSQAEDLLKTFDDFKEIMWPKYLYCKPYEQIIFEDLMESGYKMADRKEGLNLEHCLLTIRYLAKFHATSVILNEKGLLPLDSLKVHCFRSCSSEFISNLYEKSFEKFVEIMENSWEPEWKIIAEQIKTKITPIITKIIFKLLQFSDKKFNVLNHGDCWTNNLLFKYDEDLGKPVSMKFVDFQISFYNSPAIDLQYFLSTSPNLDVRRNSIKQIIEEYYKSLLAELNKYSYNCEEKLITFDQLNEELKQLDIYGIATSITILPIMLHDKPDVEQDTRQNADQNKQDTINWEDYLSSSEKHKIILKELLKSAIENKTFDNLEKLLED